MTGRLDGKVAGVTAAARGIGRATAERFAAEGARVIATDRDVEALAGIEGCETRTLDVTNAASVIAFAQEVGRIDVLANVAGIVHAGTILNCTEEDWAQAVAINMTAMYRTIRAFLPAMLEGRQGAIVNVSSIASSVKGIPNRFAYGAPKAGVIGLTKGVAADLSDAVFGAMRFARVRWTPRRCSSGCTTPETIKQRRLRSSHADRWVGSVAPTRSPRLHFTLPATRRRSRPVPSMSLTAAG